MDNALNELAVLLDEESAVGVRNPTIDNLLEKMRAEWVTLSPEQTADLGGLATQIKRMGSLRPQYWQEYAEDDFLDEDDGYWHVPEASPVAALDIDEALSALGYSGWRPGQRECVQAALDGKDVMVVMPTGGGKSLCYQVPVIAHRGDGLTVVVTPLVALMRDQTHRMQERGIRAVMLASTMEEADQRSALQAIANKSTQCVFCSPERFSSAAFLSVLGRRTVNLLAIDEAHCIAEWGHDFRPDYLRLPALHRWMGSPPLMAATATATVKVQADIERRLGMRDTHSLRAGFDRPELSWDVELFEGAGSRGRKLDRLTSGVASRLPAMVYASTRKAVEMLNQSLSENGISCDYYHAGRSAEERDMVQTQWALGEIDVVIATNAFGMGVDKADVRSVWHWNMPSSMEAYYQEAGRAGRDGKLAHATLLASKEDKRTLIYFIEQREITLSEVMEVWEKLESKAADGIAEIDLREEGQDKRRIALGVLERSGAMTLSPAGAGRLRVHITGLPKRATVTAACKVAHDHAWKGYHDIVAYAYTQDVCRRQMILEHFSDTTKPTAMGRCCDIHDPYAAAVSVKKATKSKAKAVVTPTSTTSSAPTALLANLKEWRTRVAKGKPAYTVTTNATLDRIVAARPSTPAELNAISGIGPVIMDRWSHEILALVSKHAS